MAFKWWECFPSLTGEKESSVFIWPIQTTSNVPLLIFPPNRFFNNMVDRTDSCSLINPWGSLTFSVLAFFITSWDHFFFLSLLLFFSFSTLSSQDKFKTKIWFQKQRQVTINKMSNSRNNKQLWSTWHKSKEKIDFKIKKPLVCIKRIATQGDHTYF